MPITWEYREADGCYAAEGIVYCTAPVAPELQSLNIYIPAAYLARDGNAALETTVTTAHGATYTSATVPVVFYNDIGGYAECRPAPLTERNRRYLDDGYVLVSVGARGRQSRDAEGRTCGKAPAALVDLKAALRWLRAHAEEIPAGNLDRIVSVGTSAGGAMSSLVGVTGNTHVFDAELEGIGAAMGERDDVYAAQCYCPIIDLEHADAAYEWMFQSKRVHTFKPRDLPRVLNEFEQKLSRELACRYPAYVNGLDLGVGLGADGRSGSYYNELMGYVTASLEAFLARHAATAEERVALIEELDAGAGFIHERDGHVYIDDLDAYVRVYIGRMKGCPAFDPADAGAPENEEFGPQGVLPALRDRLHFSAFTQDALASLEAQGIQGADSHLTEAYAADIEAAGGPARTTLINPMSWLAGEHGQAEVAPHVRIRLGSRDADHSFSASFNLFKALERRGIDASYGLIWGRGHCDADYPGDFSAWVDAIAAKGARIQ